MGDFLSCAECRPIWQNYRRLVATLDLPADRRRDVITAYMDLVHKADHDEQAVKLRLQLDHEAEEAHRSEIRKAIALWALIGELALTPSGEPTEPGLA